MTDTCVKCGNPLAENNIECDICGAAVLWADPRFLDRHPLLRRGQELGVALLTLAIGLALGLAIIVAIQINRSPVAAQPITQGGPLLLTSTPQFVPAIVATSATLPQPSPQPSPPKGDGNTAAPADPQFAARNQLGRATSSMAALSSYQASGSLSDTSANTAYNFDAAVIAPDKASITIRSSGTTPRPQYRAVFYGFTLYTSADGGTSWQKDSSSGPLVHLALASLWSGFDANAITSTTAVRLLGHEQAGDEPTSHLQTDLASITRAHSLLRTFNLSSYSGSVDLWVSDRDATIRRIKADISDGKHHYLLDLSFSNFNGAVQINQPQ